MTKCPIVMKRLYDLALSFDVIKKKTLGIEIAIADSRNLHGDWGEHWAFQVDDVVQLQAVNCCKCGNYKSISSDVPLSAKIMCECISEAKSDKESDKQSDNYNKELIKKMMVYEGMDAFIEVERDNDLLCEDVVGVICEFL